MLSDSSALLGRSRAGAGGSFPLLIKVLDAHQNLSLQVHPDAKTARRLGGGARGKTECWYVLSAEPESRLYLGLDPDVDRAQFTAAAGTSGLVDLVVSQPVRPGQFVFVPPGTVHAIGAGVTLVEIQENSDTTYRLFDWGRSGLDGSPRAIHVEEALKSIDYGRRPPVPTFPEFEHVDEFTRRALLADCPAFRVSLLEIVGHADRSTDGLAVVYVVIEGAGRLTVKEGGAEVRLQSGQTWLLPADVGKHRIESGDGALKLLAAEAAAEEEPADAQAR
jgi:mannose-6-phosphate isomerase